MSELKVIKNKYGQNFLHSRALVNNLIKNKTRINSEDIVIDIGLGKGIITQELAKYVKKVLAFEIDPDLAAEFRKQTILKNVELLEEDFLKYNLPKLGSVKVFANIPFFLTADIVRKLTLENDNVSEIYLIMEKEAAWRFMGQPYKNNSLISTLIQTFYVTKILYDFKRTDFVPAPEANVVLVGFRASTAEIAFRALYFDFVAYLFNLRKNTLKLALTRIFTYEQIKRLAKTTKFALNAPTSQLNVGQWLTIYKFFLTLPKEKHMLVMGEFDHVMRHQRKLNEKVVTVYNK